MHFKSIRVERFRQLRDGVDLPHLEPRLNVIAGRNETGKSTLLQAMRAALFNRYTSRVGEQLRPYGATVSPKVHLVFDLDGTEYRLTKVFSRRREGTATLEADDGHRWEGPAAEDQLAELLGFAYASRGGSRPKHQGLAGLLWVEQATAYAPVTLTNRSRQRIHQVFEQDMRELLGGDRGEALHHRIETLWGEYFDSRRKPRGDYRILGEREAELRERLQAIRGELAAYENKVDRLERQQAELRAYREDGALDKAEVRLRSAQAAAERVTELQARVRAGEEQLGRAQAERDAAKQAWEDHTKLIGEYREARQAAATAEQAVREKETESVQRNTQLAQLRTRLAELESRKQDREAEQRLVRDLETLERLEAEHTGLETQLTEARAADAEQRRCTAEQEAIRVTKAAVAKLKKIERTRDLAAERLGAAATRIQHRLEPGAEVRLGEKALAGDGSVRLTRPTELRVPGIGQLLITPGGEDLDRLQHQVKQADRQLAQGLAKAGTTDVAAAEAELRHAQELAGQADRQTAILQALAPEGLPALADQLSAGDARREELRRKLGDKTDRIDPSAPTGDLEQEVKSLRDQVSALTGEVRDQEQLAQELREALAGLRAEKISAKRLAQRREAELAQARVEAPDAWLQESRDRTKHQVDAKGRQLEAAVRALAAENPETVALEVERSQHARDDLRQELDQLALDVRDLKIELRALGQKGLAEAAASVAADHGFVALQREQSERQARALDLLQRTLADALRGTKQTVARPITDRLLPYLRQLIPDTTPMVDENLILTGIRRSGVAEVFADLSIGTREQLAVLVRLAYADLLSAAGVPVTVVLDDALVNSDAERRERMLAILYQAAQRYQILLLTCHGQEYRDSGGTFIRLEELPVRMQDREPS